VQSRLPDPEWLEAWLDRQIRFDAAWEGRVVRQILHNLSSLLERNLADVQQLNRYRETLTAAVAAPAPADMAARVLELRYWCAIQATAAMCAAFDASAAVAKGSKSGQISSILPSACRLTMARAT
jgi:hypothetical protein